jgi:hypothetical protein
VSEVTPIPRFNPTEALKGVRLNKHRRILQSSIDKFKNALQLTTSRAATNNANDAMTIHKLRNSDLQSARTALKQMNDFIATYPQYKDALGKHLESAAEIFVTRVKGALISPEEQKALLAELTGAVQDNSQVAEATVAGQSQGAKKSDNVAEESVDKAASTLINFYFEKLQSDGSDRAELANVLSQPKANSSEDITAADLTKSLDAFTKAINGAKSISDVKAAYGQLPAQAQQILNQKISEPLKAIFEGDKTGFCASLLKEKNTWSTFCEAYKLVQKHVQKGDPAESPAQEAIRRQHLMKGLESIITTHKRALNTASKAEPIAQQKMKSRADQKFKATLAEFIKINMTEADLKWVAEKVKTAPDVKGYASNLEAFMDKMKGLVSGKSLGMLAMFGLPILTSVLEHLPLGHGLATVCNWVMKLATMYSTATNLPGMFGGGSDKQTPPAREELALAA